MIIDSHQHFWTPSRGDYDWMADKPDIIKRTYLPADLAPILQAQGQLAISVGAETRQMLQRHCSDAWSDLQVWHSPALQPFLCVRNLNPFKCYAGRRSSLSWTSSGEQGSACTQWKRGPLLAAAAAQRYSCAQCTAWRQRRSLSSRRPRRCRLGY